MEVGLLIAVTILFAWVIGLSINSGHGDQRIERWEIKSRVSRDRFETALHESREAYYGETIWARAVSLKVKDDVEFRTALIKHLNLKVERVNIKEDKYVISKKKEKK